MSSVERFDNRVWDKFFDFLFCDEEPSREEVQQTLGTLGIDIAPGLRKIHQALKASQARANYPNLLPIKSVALALNIACCHRGH